MNNAKAVTCRFFKDEENYNVLHKSIRGLEFNSRELPDILTATMSKLYDKKTMGCIHIPHWHQITDEDARTLRNILQVDETGENPKSQSREYDLLQYISMCLQYLDKEYSEYVHDWCSRQEMCLDDEEDF